MFSMPGLALVLVDLSAMAGVAFALVAPIVVAIGRRLVVGPDGAGVAIDLVSPSVAIAGCALATWAIHAWADRVGSERPGHAWPWPLTIAVATYLTAAVVRAFLRSRARQGPAARV